MNGFLIGNYSTDSTMPVLFPAILSSFPTLTFQKSPSAGPTLSPDLTNVLSYLADYFSNQYVTPSSDDFGKIQDALSAADKIRYQSGRTFIANNNCVVCHLGADFRPISSIPMIFGQNPEYLKKRLKAFRAGVGGGTMPDFIKGLESPTLGVDLDNVVFYLSKTHPSQWSPPTP
jgi:cytochrome c553